MSSPVINKCKRASDTQVLRFCESIDYRLITENGQRTIKSYKRLPYTMQSFEIYVSKIPKSVNEIEIFKLFAERAGEIYELRMMYVFEEDLHRSFCYMKFFDIDAFCSALTLHYYEIRKNYHLYVRKSVNNCSLYVGNIPRNIVKEEFVNAIRRRTHAVKSVYFPQDLMHDGRNRGYAFVKFANHKSALVGRNLLTNVLQFRGQLASVDWSDPLIEPDPMVMKKVSVLYLSNLALDTTTEDVRMHIRHLVPFADQLERVTKIKNYCFVHFTDHKYADQAMNIIQGTVLLNKVIRVEWSKPSMYKKAATRTQIDPCYTSIPSKF